MIKYNEPGTCFRYSLFLEFGGGGFAAAPKLQKRAQTCHSIRAIKLCISTNLTGFKNLLGLE